MPAFGHVNPSLPLVRELIGRGEHVLYYNDVEFQSLVEASGATFRAYPAGVITSSIIARATQTGDLIRVPREILRATDALAPLLLDRLAAEQPDVVVLDSNALWGHIAVRRLQLRAVSLLTTIVLGSAEWRRLRAREWLHMLRPMLPSLIPIVGARSRLLRQFDDSVPRPAFPAFGGLNLALFPPLFQPPDPRLDASVRFVGPLLDAAARPAVPFELRDARPVVYMSLGTLHTASAAFYRECLQAFASLPVQFVLATGHQVDAAALGAIPENAVVQSSVPQLAVLERAALFITHGGMNSVLESLSYGVPMLVLPQHLEQLTIGMTVAERGAALVRREHLAGQPVPAAALRREVQRILAEPRFTAAAASLQSELRATGGPRQAADQVQAYGAVARTA